MKSLSLLLPCLLALNSCVTPSGTRILNEGNAFVVAHERSPADEIRVFNQGQHPSVYFPESHEAAWAVYSIFTLHRHRLLETARDFCLEVNADYCVIEFKSQSRGMHPFSTILVRAYCVPPRRLGIPVDPSNMVGMPTDPARSAGLQMGDRILAVNGSPTAIALRDLWNISPGETVTLGVGRLGDTVEIPVTAEDNLPTHLDLVDAATLTASD